MKTIQHQKVDSECLRHPLYHPVSSWNNLDSNIRNSLDISRVKSKIKENTIKSPEYCGEGSRKLSILHARLRHRNTTQ